MPFRQPLSSTSFEYPVIEPVAKNAQRPFWSVMIPTYNRLDYLTQTLESILIQDPGPTAMQIEVIDNASSQDIETVVKTVGRGRINFYRHITNVGMSANWTTCIRRAQGYWVHILHDDDVLFPGFYQAYQRFMQAHSDVVMLFCRALEIDADGEWQQISYTPPNQAVSGIVQDCLVKLVNGNFISAPGVVVARRVYEQIGAFAPSLSYAPDWEMWIRIATVGQMAYIHHPYLQYRVHILSETAARLPQMKPLAEIAAIIELGVRRLPQSMQKRIRHNARKHYAEYANGYRNRFHQSDQHRLALKYAVWLFKLYPSGRNWLRLNKSFFRWCFSQKINCCI
ncbi:glycosyl transferase family 2 [Candidatus Moduliflexus flocculans]|uniref:Glycosyl transferase family 2 n=1 Tax=Candidatus Moduliflexus flocculans TaxID=1499966 RepID=A0A081BMU6_9BACT|nr:glycosyl transferase family 2 [Candidatus Moduliflexus flocculans]